MSRTNTGKSPRQTACSHSWTETHMMIYQTHIHFWQSMTPKPERDSSPWSPVHLWGPGDCHGSRTRQSRSIRDHSKTNTSFSRLGQLERTPLSDRKSTRLNSSHEWISYAVFCL